MANLFEDVNPDDMDYLLNPDADGEYGETQDLLIDQLIPFQNHPFRVDTEADDFKELHESIQEYGVLLPILVRPSGEFYEIIVGHRRVTSCKMAGKQRIPAIIRELDDYEATILMVHSNLHREKISISEKAKSYRMCFDAAEKHAGKKGEDTMAKIGGDKDSKRSVYRYIRPSYLNENLLEMVDGHNISMGAGVSLSYLDEESQHNLRLYIEDQEKYPTMEMAAYIQGEYEKNYKEYESSITYDDFVIMFQQKEESPKKKTLSNSISLKRDELSEYFEDDADTDHIKEIILTLLQRYHAGEFGDI